jgi:hypothetical protein
MTKILSKEVAFNGKLRTAVDGASIGPNDFQVLKNLRYTDTNVRGVQGHTKINATAAPETAVRNLFHFRKDQPSESHLLIDANLKVYDCTGTIPNADSVIATPIYTDVSGASTGRYAVAPNGFLSRCTGKESLLYGGKEFSNVFMIDKPAANNVYDYSDAISNTLTDSLNLATLHTSAATAATATFYVGSPLPIDGVKFYVSSGTGKPTGMIGKYWSGSAWAGVGSPVDGTSGLQATGNNWFTFTSTKSTSNQYPFEKILAHWYQFTVTATADFNAVPKISQITCSIPMQPAQDLFDGIGRPCASLTRNTSGTAGADLDFTSNVLTSFYDSTDATTWVDFGATVLNSSGNVTFGFPERCMGVMLYIGGTPNVNAQTIASLEYWNGSAWSGVTASMQDGTLNDAGTATMTRSGWVTWDAPDENLEFPQTNLIGHQEVSPAAVVTPTQITNEFPLYYYRMKFSGNLAGNSQIYQVKGIPAQTQVKGYTFSSQYAGRLMLCDNADGARNSVRYSAYQTANVLNGEDSGELFFGGEEALSAAAAIYNRYGSTETNTFVVCKRGETWVLSGDDPEKWTKFQVSNNIGCVAPRSMVPINLSPKESTQQVSYNAAVWVSARGVEVFAGGSIATVSDDIGDLFDPSLPTYLGAAVIPTITAFYDPILSEYHMIVPGSYEYVWDTKRNKWFQVVRGTELYGGAPVADTNGYRYCYGYNNAGFVMRLENGTSFDGTAIAHTLRTGDMALPDGSIMEWAQINWFTLIAKAKTVTAQTVAMVYYNDTQTASYGATTVSPARSGYRLINTVIHNKDVMSTFHGFQFSISTTDETTGFEPMYLGVRYTVFPRQLS